MMSSQAVFISYAREDFTAAHALADALRRKQVEVWLDRSELVGGDAWDAKIRRQIKDCGLFVALISKNTDARLEGYFRREWKLAIDRTHDMADEKAFLLPVVIGDLVASTSRVPEKFRDVQWIKWADESGVEVVVQRVQALLEGTASGTTAAPFRGPAEGLTASREGAGTGVGRVPVPSGRRWRAWGWSLAGLVVLSMAAATFLGVRVRPTKINASAKNARTNDVNSPALVGKAANLPKAGGGAGTAARIDPPLRPKGAAVNGPSEASQLAAKATLLWEKWDDATHADWALADELCKRAVELDPADGEVWAVYAQVACGQYEFSHNPAADDLARSRAERAVQLAPISQTVRLALANAYRTNESTLPESERLLRALASEVPNAARVLRTLGETLRAQNRWEEALSCFDQAAGLPGGDPLALLAKSFTLEELGRFGEAEAAASESIAQRLGPAALLRKMECQLDFRGDLVGAAETLARVPASALLDDRAIALACQLWFWKRQPEKCLAVLSAASRDFLPGNFWNGAPRGWLPGRVHQLGNRPAAAEAHWRGALKVIEKALDEDPEETNLIFWSARLHACLAETAEAEKMLELARQLATGGLRITSPMLAAIEVLLGRPAQAVAHLETLVQTAVGPALRIALQHDPVFDPLRSNERFAALLIAPAASAAH